MQGGRRVLPAEGSRAGDGAVPQSRRPGQTMTAGPPPWGCRAGGAPPGGAGDAFFREKLCDEE